MLAEREALQQDTDKMMSWIRETEKQLKAPLKVRLKSEDLQNQLDKARELQTDITEHEAPLEKILMNTEEILTQTQSPVKAELKNKMDGEQTFVFVSFSKLMLCKFQISKRINMQNCPGGEKGILAPTYQIVASVTIL